MLATLEPAHSRGACFHQPGKLFLRKPVLDSISDDEAGQTFEWPNGRGRSRVPRISHSAASSCAVVGSERTDDGLVLGSRLERDSIGCHGAHQGTDLGGVPAEGYHF